MSLIHGEEWREATDVEKEDIEGIRSHEEVMAEAEARILRERRRKLKLRCLDEKGRPLTREKIHVRQKDHEFIFGCSAASTLNGVRQNPPEAARSQHFLELFNGSHAKCYWDEAWHQPIEKEQGRRRVEHFLEELEWGNAHGLAMRGHPLVWTVDKAIPQWMRRYPIEKQLQFLEHHVRSMAALGRGKVHTWDLCNEMLWEPSLLHLSQRHWPHIESTQEMVDTIAPAMAWAQEEDPSALYCINDYGLECSIGWLKGSNHHWITAAQQRERMVALSKALDEAGAGVDAVGTQAHTGRWFPMGLLERSLADLAKTGKAIHITEFWAHDNGHPSPKGKSPEQVELDRAKYVEDFYTLAFSTPEVTQISFWGNADLFPQDGWKTSPTYRALFERIRKTWWTDTQGQTDGDGTLEIDLFHGPHELIWHNANGKLRVQAFHHSSKHPSPDTLRFT